MEGYIYESFDKRLIHYIRALANEFNCICKEEWHNKYDLTVVSNVEPIIPESYYLNIKLVGDKNYVKFIDYLLRQRKKILDKLYAAWELKTKKKRKKKEDKTNG